MSYKTYETYKYSGVSWIGEIPEHWGMEKLEHYIEIITGHPFNSDFFSSEGLPLIRIRDLNEENTSVFWNRDYPNYAIINTNDLLVGMDGDFDVVSWKGGTALLNQRILKINSKKHLLNNYLKFFLQIPIKFINDLTMSTTVKHLSSNDVGKIQFMLPSFSEQEKIAKYLDQKTSKIDENISKNKELISLLEEKKTALINQVVTKGLDSNVPLKDSGIEWISEIPDHWKLVRNKNLFVKSKVIVGQQWEKFPVLSLTKKGVIIKDIELNEGKMPSDFSIYQIVNPGNLLLCLFDIDVTPRCVGFIKNKGIVSAAYSEIKPIDKIFMKYYFYWYLMLDLDKRLLHLSKNLRNSLSTDDFMSLPIVKPPLDEQIKIAEFLDNETLKIDEIIDKIQSNIEFLEEYKNSLIHHVVTGKIDVRDEI